MCLVLRRQSLPNPPCAFKGCQDLESEHLSNTSSVGAKAVHDPAVLRLCVQRVMSEPFGSQPRTSVATRLGQQWGLCGQRRLHVVLVNC